MVDDHTLPPLTAIDREFKLTPADFRAIAAIIHEDAGIHLPEGKASLVYTRLAKRLRTLNFTKFSDYVAVLEGPNATAERRFLLTALTTNVTRFFREPHHFQHLRATVLAPLAAANEIDRLRLWSAACSTGQEAYSIAAVVADVLPASAWRGIKILATDIDPDVIETARRGFYESIEGIPPEMRRWFGRDGSGWTADPALRNLITFKCLNLNALWPVRGPFNVIFCRNVAIYFDQTAQARLWSSFAAVTAPGSTLYIGHSERVSGAAAAEFDNVGITTYRRRSPGP